MEIQGRLQREDNGGHVSVRLHALLAFSCKECLTQYVVELVQVVFPREDGLVGQHLSQNAAH